MNLPKTLSSTAKIRFQDCDPFNHLNNGKYTSYFINHREDMLAEVYNLDIFKMAKTQGKSWVSSSNQIAYLRSAHLMETVLLESELVYFDDTNLKVEMRMYNLDKTELKSILWAGFTHFNLVSQKRETHSEKLLELFKSVIIPTNFLNFEERLHTLKQKLVS